MPILRKIKRKENGVEETVHLGALAQNITQDATHRFVTDTEKQAWNSKPGSTSGLDNNVVTFTEAATRENLQSGEKLSISFGKIKKWFSDLGAAAFMAVANNCTTTAAGSALDARQGKVLMDKANQLSSDLGGCRFGYTADGLPGYKKEGADTVYPFSVLSYIANLQSKYGTGNNAIIRGVPANINGYELALYGFQHLYLSGAMNNAAVMADNTCANAGASAWMTTISGTYGGYYVKAGTPYIIKDHSIAKDTTVNLSDDVPGYRLAGAILHFSGYSSTNSSGGCSASLGIDYAAGTVAVSTSFPVSLVTCTAKLLYLPE